MNAVLDLLRDQEYLPSEVIEKLLGTYSESDVKEAVAQLLHDQELELTPDRHLHVLTVAV
jgi:hypothetical protein